MATCPKVTVSLAASVRPCGREHVEFQGEEPDGEQSEPEGRGGFERVRGGADAPVEQAAWPACGQHAEARAEDHGDGEGGRGEQYGPAQAFADDIGDRLAHDGGVAEVATERGGQPVPPAAHERLVDTEVGPKLVEVLLRRAEACGARIRLDRVEGGSGGDGEDAERHGGQDGDGEQRPPSRHPAHRPPGEAVVHFFGVQSSTFHHGPDASPWSCGSTWVVRAPKRSFTT